MFRRPKLAIALALVLLFVLASLALAQVTPSVSVIDQAIQNNTVTVEKVTAAEPGWIVIHADSAGKPGADIGHAAVQTGDNNNVMVTIDPTKATPILYAMLHVDKGITNTYEFPGPDVPVQVNGQVVSVPFRVTNLAAVAGTAAPTAGATTAATAASGATAAATGTVAPTTAVETTTAATAAPAVAAAATTAPTAAATAAGPTKLPTTGGPGAYWLLPLLAFVALFLVAGLGLNLARRAR
jgi:hypothetical protein